jgi:hypothetical protein
MRDPTPCAMFSLRFQFSIVFVELVEKDINHEAENVLYNYTNATSMSRS